MGITITPSATHTWPCVETYYSDYPYALSTRPLTRGRVLKRPSTWKIAYVGYRPLTRGRVLKLCEYHTQLVIAYRPLTRGRVLKLCPLNRPLDPHRRPLTRGRVLKLVYRSVVAYIILGHTHVAVC